jgi:hypothetical protein
MRTRFAGIVACAGDSACNILEKLNRRKDLGDLGIDGMAIIKLT